MSEQEIVVTDEMVALGNLLSEIEASSGEGRTDAAGVTVDFEAGQLSVIYEIADGRFVRATYGVVELQEVQEVPVPEKPGLFDLYASKEDQAKAWRYEKAIREARWPR